MSRNRECVGAGEYNKIIQALTEQEMKGFERWLYDEQRVLRVCGHGLATTGFRPEEPSRKQRSPLNQGQQSRPVTKVGHWIGNKCQIDDSKSAMWEWSWLV